MRIHVSFINLQLSPYTWIMGIYLILNTIGANYIYFILAPNYVKYFVLASAPYMIPYTTNNLLLYVLVH